MKQASISQIKSHPPTRKSRMERKCLAALSYNRKVDAEEQEIPAAFQLMQSMTTLKNFRRTNASESRRHRAVLEGICSNSSQ